ncbi:uncharacterized protein FOBCDRAFT_46963 [Fusarium oxysporum Fo47]|uniref:uncharacterized protein n=1 Tax=Fusarium oxysporum Fo47 TaxID=660027 RepID=UPI0027ABA2E0|nr:uncharacterized protein FOBCDRAFT_46963 [Fusarium oxysporum Fo47]KAJ9417599.1 hypothetical protein QL093DRAFT_2416111 [Fusarium oxysporum]WJG35996.1 hypothetical protein FOBCDRAFT_46963 [Fusarium oxysporum Fo47]
MGAATRNSAPYRRLRILHFTIIISGVFERRIWLDSCVSSMMIRYFNLFVVIRLTFVGLSFEGLFLGCSTRYMKFSGQGSL